jgi:hypothetical protein
MTPYARQLYDELVAGGSDALLERVRAPDAEDPWLDFKQSELDYKGLTKLSQATSDQKNLAKALSGFFNVEGGVMVWGIKCADDKSEVPFHERTLEPGLRDAQTLQNVLLQNVSRSTSPPVPGVLTCIVPLPNGRDALLMYIPGRAGRLPVRTHVSSKVLDKDYYLRAGESFAPIPATWLSSMLGASPPPALELECSVAPPSIVVTVRNTGLGFAREPYLLVDVDGPTPLNKLSVDPYQYVSVRKGPQSVVFSGLATPPAASVRMCSIRHPERTWHADDQLVLHVGAVGVIPTRHVFTVGPSGLPELQVDE